jgi:peptidoglycan-associated lipoprotein
MKGKPFLSLFLAVILVAGLLGGCAKKQVREEAEVTAQPAQQPRVVQEPIKPQPVEPPPQRSAAVEPAPKAPVAGGGLAQDTTPGLQRIHFDFDRYGIRTDAAKVLEDNAVFLSANPGVRIRIEGHCDERGTTEYNLALGERRAKSAFQYLMDLGVDPNRMSVVSYGEEVPLDSRHNEEAWALNRRAEFVEIQR